MQNKEVKVAQHLPMDARMMPRPRNVIAIQSVENIGSVNFQILEKDAQVTRLQAQIKTLFKQRKSSRNKLFY